jgi:hypothetical protein
MTYLSLYILFGVYLNEDWPVFYGEPWNAIEAFARREPEHAPRLRTEVERVLETIASEEQVRDFVLDDLECNYLPELDGWTYRDWLLALADRVDEVRHELGAADQPGEADEADAAEAGDAGEAGD